MTRFSTIAFGPLEFVGAAFSLPLISLALALVVTGAILAITGSRDGREGSGALSVDATRSVRAKYVPEQRALGLGAIAVVLAFAVENVVRGYVLDLADVVAWWRFATPIGAVFLAATVLWALIRSRGSAASEAPVVTGTRRAWTSFGPRTGLVAGAGVLLLLLGTTTIAGFASAADGRGRYIWLEVPIPNEPAIDPIRSWFYGWAFGVPVLISLAALIAASWAVLHANAVRPFIRPDTVTMERAVRGEVARGTVRISTAGMLLALAGAWRLIAGAGSTSQLVIEGQNGGNPYDASWRYAELATMAGWLAPALEIVAFVLLLLVASTLPRRTRAAHPASTSEEFADVAGRGL